MDPLGIQPVLYRVIAVFSNVWITQQYDWYSEPPFSKYI
jgi:hypothetical protein